MKDIKPIIQQEETIKLHHIENNLYKKETQMNDITITGCCAKCHQWATPDFLATLRLSAHAGGDVCLNCLADKSWGYLKRHVCSADYPKVARYKQFVES